MILDTAKRSESSIWSVQLGWGILHGVRWLRWSWRVIWCQPRWQV